MKLWIVAALWALAHGLEAQDHQRVGVSGKQTHVWEVSAETSLTPYGQGAWFVDVVPRVSYELEKTWWVAAAIPYAWNSNPLGNGTDGTWGLGSLSAGWSTQGDVRWRASISRDFLVVPQWEFQAAGYEFGIQWLRDPVIFSVSSGVSPRDDGWSGQSSFAFQEVVNDVTTWSITLSPRWFWYGGTVFWTLSATWGVGWYEHPNSVATTISSGSAAPWSWATSASRTWEFR